MILPWQLVLITSGLLAPGNCREKKPTLRKSVNLMSPYSQMNFLKEDTYLNKREHNDTKAVICKL